MTRDEYRAKCIEVMAGGYVLDDAPARQREYIRDRMKYAFDALHGIVRVCPIKATDEMLHAGRNYFSDGLTAYDAIAAAADLTNPPEKKT